MNIDPGAPLHDQLHRHHHAPFLENRTAVAGSLEIKSLLGVLRAQVGVPKLPRHAQGETHTVRAGPTTDTTTPAQGTPSRARTPQDFHRSRVGEAHEVLRGASKSQPRTEPRASCGDSRRDASRDSTALRHSVLRSRLLGLRPSHLPDATSRPIPPLGPARQRSPPRA